MSIEKRRLFIVIVLIIISLKNVRWRDVDLRDLVDVLRFRGFQKLALKHVSFGIQEMLRSAFIGLQLKELQKYIPQIEAADITRYSTLIYSSFVIRII